MRIDQFQLREGTQTASRAVDNHPHLGLLIIELDHQHVLTWIGGMYIDCSIGLNPRFHVST